MTTGPPGRRCLRPLHRTPFGILLTLGQALARDGFRCAVTGAFDKTLIEHIPELQREQERLNASVVVIETSHIVNEPTTRGIGASERSAVMNMVCPVFESPPESSFAIRSHLFHRRVILLALFPACNSLDLKILICPSRQSAAFIKPGTSCRCNTTFTSRFIVWICHS